MNNRTYAEQRGKKPFDWMAFLSKEKFTRRQLGIATGLAESWVTCACGNQCDIIPREADGAMPVDHELRTCGVDFSITIDAMSFFYGHRTDFEQHRTAALLYLYAIERRSAEILAEIRAKRIQERLSALPY